MAKVNYKDAWHTLKEEMTQEYIEMTNSWDDVKVLPHKVLDKYLERIDELDNSNEFSNLKSDMEREYNTKN